MIKGLIRLVFFIVALIVLSQLEYKGRPLKDHALEIYNSPTVQLLVQWGRMEATKLLGMQPAARPALQQKTMEQISEQDQKGLDTLLKKVDK